MTNRPLRDTEENSFLLKRKRVLAAVADENDNSDDDDNISDGMDICNIISKQTKQGDTATSCALYDLRDTIRNTLLEINKVREENRERRHRELLQILTNILQQEKATTHDITTSTNLDTEVENNEQNISTGNAIKHGYLDKVKFLHVENIGNDACITKPLENSLEVTDLKNNKNIDFICTAQNSAAKCTTLSDDQITKTIAISKRRFGVNAVKHDDRKKEYQIMRAQMLDLQREKMKDRERKKRELLRTQNM